MRLLKYSAAAIGLLLFAGAVASGLMFALVFFGSELGEVDQSVSASRELEVELAGDDRVLEFDFSVAMDEASLHGLSGPPGVSVEVEGRWIPVGGHEPTEASTTAGLLVPEIRAEVSSIPQSEGTHDASTAAHDRMCPTTSACSWPFRVKLTRGDDTNAPVTTHLRIRAGASYVERVPDEAELEVRFDTLDDNIRIVNFPDARRLPVHLPSADGSTEPSGFVSFVRTHGASDTPVVVRLPTTATQPSQFQTAVVPLDGGSRTAVPMGGSSTFHPFIGCPSKDVCVRQYRLAPRGDHGQPRTPPLQFQAPNGVIIERELAVLPPLEEPLTVQETHSEQAEPNHHGAVSAYLVIETAHPMQNDPLVAAHLHARLDEPRTGPLEISVQGPSRTINADRPAAAVGRYLGLPGGKCQSERVCRIWIGFHLGNPGDMPAGVTWTLTAAIDRASIETEVTDLRIELSR